MPNCISSFFKYIFIDLKMQIFIKFLKDLYRDKIKKSLKIRICSRMRNIDFWRSNCKSVLFLYAYLKTFSEEVFLKIIFEIFEIFIIFQDFMKSINFHWFSYENHYKNQCQSIKKLRYAIYPSSFWKSMEKTHLGVVSDSPRPL